MTVPDIGTGFTIASSGANSAFWAAAEVTDVTLPPSSVEAIQTSHQGTTTAHTYMAADIPENGSLECTTHIDAAVAPTQGGPNETYTVTCPDTSTWVFAGFIENYAPSGVFNELMVASVSVKVSGDITRT